MAKEEQLNTSSLPRPGSHLTNNYTPSEGSTVAVASEDSPLLGSRSTSPTLRDVSPGEFHRSRTGGAVGAGTDDDDAVQHHVTPIRAVCICLSIWILMFMQACNMSGMTMVQGNIADDLEAYDGAMWFTSVYLIVMASTSPLASRLATIFSLRHMILATACLFALGAIVTSRAESFAIFLLGRTLTGMAGGCIMTLSLILVLQLTSRRRRGLFVGMVNAGFTVGISAGAVVFGALLPVLGWRELFLVQAPVSLLAGFGVYLSIPASTSDGLSKDKSTLQKLKTIDYGGALCLTATIVLFLYGLSGTIQPLPMILSILTLALFVFNEYKLVTDPLIPLSILRSRGVLLSCLAQLGLMSARWTVLYYAPIFVLAVRGLPPTIAGSVLIPTNVGFGLGGLLVGWLHVRRAGSFYIPCLVSIFLFGLAIFGLSLLSNAVSPAWAYVLVVFCNGFCTGAALNYTLAHILHVSAPGTHYISTGLLATFRGFAGSFGTSIGGGVFTRKLREQLTIGYARLDATDGLSPARLRFVTRLVGSPNFVFSGALSDAERDIAIHGYEAALKVMYTSAAVLIIFVLVIQAGTGWTELADQEDEEEIQEEFAEHDGRMEA
ncbi:MFS general substrate transporter [Cryphonectria parasitica EP155]|uniref:MFS general substrate transporter n=1 Tax=Cryphonectria parasitica (strain ATCC 38755 / EP155) TaxID=660469 RepID=A0A9P4XX71_CRYP1|nr:MFS general substrate transporter [Cryphonectria parasitica EP155]KAF3762939.1 MFS general substrate transporter [Cryphonectria parasitica EP155]